MNDGCGPARTVGPGGGAVGVGAAGFAPGPQIGVDDPSPDDDGRYASGGPPGPQQPPHRRRRGEARMPADRFTDDELAAFLAEQASPETASAIERAARDDESLRRRLAAVARRQDLGDHSVGAVWREHRLSCPDRAELGAYLLGTLNPGREDYLGFHIREVGCRYCLANLADLEAAAEAGEATLHRRRRLFESSAGQLDPRPP